MNDSRTVFKPITVCSTFVLLQIVPIFLRTRSMCLFLFFGKSRSLRMTPSPRCGTGKICVKVQNNFYVQQMFIFNKSRNLKVASRFFRWLIKLPLVYNLNFLAALTVYIPNICQLSSPLTVGQFVNIIYTKYLLAVFTFNSWSVR